jgi:hypothetical protein
VTVALAQYADFMLAVREYGFFQESGRGVLEHHHDFQELLKGNTALMVGNQAPD